MKNIYRVLAFMLALIMIVAVLPITGLAAKEDYWFAEKEAVTGYAYSMVFVPDTQILLANDPANFPKIYDWILENKEEKNIQYVLGLGDITDFDANDEWELAYEQIGRMNNVVPYSLTIGNHDTSERFNRTFNKEPYISSFEGSYDDKIENTWRTLNIGDIQYLIMTLDYGPTDDVLEWANGVLEAHPDHNVIITTHEYLYKDGTTQGYEDGWSAGKYDDKENDGDDIWEKLVCKHENVVLVVNGHTASDRVVMSQVYGDNDNVVTQMLIDHQDVDEEQGSAGMICIFYFSEDGGTVTVETYSTVREMYYMEENQFTFNLAVVGKDGASSASFKPVKRNIQPVSNENEEANQETGLNNNIGDSDSQENDTPEGNSAKEENGVQSEEQNAAEVSGTMIGTQKPQTEGADISANPGGQEQKNNPGYIVLALVGVILAGGIITMVVRKRSKANN